MLFDLVAEVTQCRKVKGGSGNPAFDFYGGSTVILGPKGDVRYVVYKPVTDNDRLARQRKFSQAMKFENVTAPARGGPV